MRETEVLIADLLPIDVEVQWHGVQQYAGGEPLKPVRTLPYPEDDSTKQILLDGHHTAKAARLRGLVAVRSHIIVSDEELVAYLRAERPWWPSLESMDELREQYRTDWSKTIERQGITTIDDIPEVIHVPRSWRRPQDLQSIPVDRNGNPL